MTLDEFVDALTTCKNNFTWSVDYSGRIRALIHPLQPPDGFCPLTALALRTHGQMFSLHHTMAAAALLDLSPLDRHCIIAAADAAAFDGDPAAALRKRILTCLGLEEIRRTTP